jgi:ADP-glucose pyrophosphorylase
MSKKIVAVNAGPRKGWNTDTLIMEAARGAESAGAQVENCLIMNDTVIGENATLKNVILDKDVIVRPGATLMGTESNPIIVRKGEIV